MQSLSSALGGGEQSASQPGHFTTREKAPGIQWIGMICYYVNQIDGS